MIAMRAATILLLVSTAVGQSPTRSPATASKAKVGEPHPQIVLPAADGTGPIALSGFRGKKVLLIHFASWSEDCRRRLPAWVERTRSLVESKKLVVVAVAQEQHADRARLLVQWLNADWIVLHDPLNLLGIRAVPKMIALDEQGIVRDTNPRPDTIAESFVLKDFAKSPSPTPEPETTDLPDPRITRRIAGESRVSGPWRDHGDALVLAGLPPQLDEAIAAYEKALTLNHDDFAAAFRLGVARRIRFERPERHEDDFQQAVTAWQRAVRGDPRHSIYQARVKQYGPAVDREHGFYGWINEARAAIAARGQTPVSLAVEPSPAEQARPAGEFKVSSRPVPERDRKATVDAGNLVRITQAVVRGTEKRNQSIAMVHLVLTLDADRHARWCNTKEPLRVWIQRPQTGRLAEEYVELPNPPAAESTEERTVNFQLRLPPTKKGILTFKAQVLYWVHESGESAEPRLLRRDVDVRVPL